VVRRVLSLTELDPKAGGFELKEIFAYNVVDDTFSASVPQELVDMKAQRLQQVMRLFGWDERDLERELNQRASNVERMVIDKQFTSEEVREAFRRFHVKKYGLAY